MIDKRVIIGGFAIGAAAGTAMLTVSSAPRANAFAGSISPTGAQPSADVSPKTKNFANADRMSDVAMSALREAYQSPPAFESMVAAVARRQGGQISIRQMIALAEIYSQQYGVPPSYRDRQFGRVRTGVGASPSDPDAALRGSIPPASRSSSRTLSTSYADEQTARRYRGSSGADYQYDLSNPADQLKYSTDPSAQLQDSVSIDPRVEMDRSLGQRGGGVQRR